MINKCTKHKISDMTTPKSGNFNIVIDNYWIVTDKNEVLKFRGINFLYNPDHRIGSLLLKQFKGCKIKQIPIMYVPWRD